MSNQGSNGRLDEQLMEQLMEQFPWLLEPETLPTGDFSRAKGGLRYSERWHVGLITESSSARDYHRWL